jgi:hypothetical protein
LTGARRRGAADGRGRAVGDYKDLGGDDFVKRDAVRERDRAVNQLLSLGYKVTLEEAYLA